MLVDVFPNHKVLSFMDTFSRYNQINMNLDDQEKTTFITKEGLYCYRAMSFGLKNAARTYQWLVNKMFTDKIGQTIEVYVNNMMVETPIVE